MFSKKLILLLLLTPCFSGIEASNTLIDWDCWSLIADYLSYDEQKTLRLINKDFNNNLFYGTVTERPKICLGKVRIPPFHENIQKEVLNKRLEHMQSFFKKSCIDSLIIRKPDTIMPLLARGAQFKNLDLQGAFITPTNLALFFSNCPNLVFLNLSRWFSLRNDSAYKLVSSKSDNLILKKLNYLTDLDLGNAQINTKQLRSILEASPYLKKLNLWNLENVNLNFLKDLELKELTELRLCSDFITTQELQGFLKQSPFVKKLTLSGLKKVAFESFDAETLKNITELDLRFIVITTKGLQHFFVCCPNLEKLTLDCLSTQEDFDWSDVDWSMTSKLLELKLQLLRLDPNGFQKILDGCSVLRALSFYQLRNRPFAQCNWNNRLPQLTEIRFKQSPLDSKDLQQILYHCIHLKKISFRHDGKDRWNKNTVIGNLNWSKLASSLLELKFMCPAVNNEGLKAIFKGCTALQKFKFNIDVDCPLNLSILEWGQLPNLRELDCRDTTITEDTINKIVETCKHLQVLNLYGCTYLPQHMQRRLSRHESKWI